MDICTDTLFLKVLFYFQTALKISRIVVPIGLILKLILDFYKVIISENEDIKKEIISLSSKRIVAAIIIFFIPSLINGIISLIEETISLSGEYQSCLVNIEYINYYEELDYKEKELKVQLEREQAINNVTKLTEEQKKVITENKKTPTNSEGKTYGQTYTSLTDEQIQNIAKICQQEQGSPEGAAKEAALMANRYEVLANKKTYKTLYDYVLKSGWWSPANSGSYKKIALKPSVLSSVKKVLINGQRDMLPLYIDEHDYIGDISKIKNPGEQALTSRKEISKKSNYKKDKTVIYNNYNSVYTYYTHADSSAESDPFGYTSEAKRKVDSMNK